MDTEDTFAAPKGNGMTHGHEEERALGQGVESRNEDHLWSRATITVAEAATILGVSRRSAYQAARTDELPTITIGRRILVPTAALRRFLGMGE